MKLEILDSLTAIPKQDYFNNSPGHVKTLPPLRF